MSGKPSPMGKVHVNGMDWLKFLLYGAAMVVSLRCANAFGAYITMVTDFSVTVKPDELALVVTAENRGDVPAHAVQFEVVINDRVLTSSVVDALGQGKKTSADFALAYEARGPGRYPVAIKTYYEDASGHRFTALAVGFYDYRSSLKPTVSINGRAARIPVDGKGQITFVLRNDGQTEQQIDLALFVPNELSVIQEHRVVEIGAQQESTVVFDLENYSALANSSYPISLIGQYEDAGNHFSMTGSAVVRIAEDVKPAVRSVWIWVLLGGLIPGTMVFLRLQKSAGFSDR